MFFKCIRDRRQVIQAKMPGGLVGQLYTRRNRSDVKCIHCSDSWYFSSTITTSRKRFQYMYYALDVCIMRRAGFFFKSRRWYGRQSNTTVCIHINTFLCSGPFINKGQKCCLFQENNWRNRAKSKLVIYEVCKI